MQAPDQGAGDRMVPSSGLTALGLSCPPGIFWGQVEVDRNLVARLFFGMPCRGCCCFVWIHLSKCFCGLVWPGEADGSSGSALQATSEDQSQKRGRHRPCLWVHLRTACLPPQSNCECDSGLKGHTPHSRGFQHVAGMIARRFGELGWPP